MKCPYCNSELEAGASFCGICGNPITKVQESQGPSAFCPECGSLVTDEMFYCEVCGCLLKEGGARRTPVYEHEYEEEDDYKDTSGTVKKLVIALVVVLIVGICAVAGYLAVANGWFGNESGSPSPEIAAGPSGGGESGAVAGSESTDSQAPTTSAPQTETPTESSAEPSTESSAAQTQEQGYGEGIHSYEYIVSDVTWSQAYEACVSRGGHLATFETSEEFKYVCDEIVDNDKRNIIFFIGGRRDIGSKDYHWVNEDNQLIGEKLNGTGWQKSWWMQGEPSYEDQGVEEYCMDIFYRSSDERWVWNDAPNDVLAEVSYYAGKIGYICEYE